MSFCSWKGEKYRGHFEAGKLFKIPLFFSHFYVYLSLKG